MVPLRQAHHRRISQGQGCVTAHTSTPYLRKSPQQTLQGTGTDHKCFAFCSNCSNTQHNPPHRCYAPTYVPRE
jgi:hypothetical protein